MKNTEDFSCAAYDKLKKALESEHLYGCDDSHGCDITVAYEQGLYLLAADLLGSATDEGIEETTAALERVYNEYTDKVVKDWLDAERTELLKLPHVRCEKCNSVQWNPEHLTACTQCHAALPITKEEDDDP